MKTLLSIVIPIIAIFLLVGIISRLKEEDNNTTHATTNTSTPKISSLVKTTESDEVHINRKIDEYLYELRNVTAKKIESVDIALDKMNNCTIVNGVIQAGFDLKIDSMLCSSNKCNT
jgi:hypothetical protein